ncbi:hypothetical protein M2408_003379 [Sphingobacterium sp. BIGb0165]|nr:hypothetical protein [Sphingobacterium sp. BIGb0165]
MYLAQKTAIFTSKKGLIINQNENRGRNQSK